MAATKVKKKSAKKQMSAASRRSAPREAEGARSTNGVPPSDNEWFELRRSRIQGLGAFATGAIPARTRACAFHVLRATPPEAAGDALGALRRSLLIDLNDPASSVSRPLSPHGAGAAPASRGQRPSPLARRIDALSRALAKPEPIIRRLARYIAGLPPGLLRPSTDKACSTGVWRHGQPEFVDAGFHLARAMKVFDRIEPG